jgi:hypothetical protein
VCSPNARTHRSEARRVGQGEVAHRERMVPVRELPPGSCRWCGHGARRNRQTQSDTEAEERNERVQKDAKKLMAQQSPSRLVERVDGAARIRKDGTHLNAWLCSCSCAIWSLTSVILPRSFEKMAIKIFCILDTKRGKAASASEFHRAPLSPLTKGRGGAEGMEPPKGSGEPA